MGIILKNIMIFDDSSLIRTSLAFYLNKMGYCIIEVADARTAINLMMKSAIDLFIIDIDMADMERIEFLNAIKNNENTRNIPIIMISSEYSYNILEEYDNTGTRSWTINPFEPAKLFVAIKNLLVM